MASAEEPLTAVVKSVNDFTLDLYLTAAELKGPEKNVLVSPLSAALVTAMVHAGARGETANEITKALRLPKDQDVLEKGFLQLHDLLANTQNVTLEVVNKIFLEQTKKLKEEYAKKVSDFHKSDVQTADFLKDADGQRVKINNIVSEKTHQKINDLLPPGLLTADTRLVLVNAVYFYGKWKEQFDRQQTYDEDFYVTKDKPVKVPMMHLTKNLRYADIPELDAKAVELCYANERVCLQIILPNARDGLAAMQQKLRDGVFDLANIEFSTTKVQLSMPKFKLEETIDIKAIYKKMGMNLMFSDSADLSGMIDGEGLAVSDAIQKTFMDVNEEGTEAAAATACVTRRKRCLEEIVQIFVDHPFAFRLLNGISMIFMGSHSEPTIFESDDDVAGQDKGGTSIIGKTQNRDKLFKNWDASPKHCEL